MDQIYDARSVFFVDVTFPVEKLTAHQSWVFQFHTITESVKGIAIRDPSRHIELTASSREISNEAVRHQVGSSSGLSCFGHVACSTSRQRLMKGGNELVLSYFVTDKFPNIEILRKAHTGKGAKYETKIVSFETSSSPCTA